MAPMAEYSSSERMKGTRALLIILAMLSKKSVFVMSAISSALVDTGEHLSPKKIPDITAPPVSTGESPSAFPAVIEITPMVAALPNDVPVRNDTSELMMNAAGRNQEGEIALKDQ